ncbi:MAG TPA: hypothetical protein VK974_07420 [Methylophilaceae bacterium]|nr:hypothetical protein [Methylophilaceae bacterium]
MNIPEAVVLSEPKTQLVYETKVKPQKILLVLDFSLEYPRLAPNFFHSKESVIERSYGETGRLFVKRINEIGLSADYVLHTSPLPFQLTSSEYSHVLIEKIDRLTAVSSTKYGDYAKDRVWKANLIERNDSGKYHSIYTQIYTSDGVDCVLTAGYMASAITAPNMQGCKDKYIQHLLSHLSIIGLAWESKIASVK